MRHHVQPLRCSQRDNVIVWASLWPRLKRMTLTLVIKFSPEQLFIDERKRDGDW